MYELQSSVIININSDKTYIDRIRHISKLREHYDYLCSFD